MTESTADPTMVEQFWNSINREAQEAGRGLFSEMFPAVADAWDGERLHIRREYAETNDGVAYPVLSGGQPPEIGKRVWCARVGDGAVVLGRVSEEADETISSLRNAINSSNSEISNLYSVKYNRAGGDISGQVNIKSPGEQLTLFDTDSGTQQDHWVFQNFGQTLRVYWRDFSTGQTNIAFTISPGGLVAFDAKLTAAALESEGILQVAGKINPAAVTEFGRGIVVGGNVQAESVNVGSGNVNASNYNQAGGGANFGGSVSAGAGITASGPVVAAGNVLADGGNLVGDGLNVRSGNVALPAGSVAGSRIGYESIDYTRIKPYTIGGVRMAGNSVDTRVINMSDLFAVLDSRYAPYHFH